LIKIHKKINPNEKSRMEIRFDDKSDNHFSQYLIDNSKLCFWVRNSEHALFWQKKLLTQALGLYTSYYNSEAEWSDAINHTYRSCQKIDQQTIHLQLAWKHIPLQQLWILHFLSETELEWIVQIDVKQRILFQKEQINVMLSPHYTNWRTENREGTFPEDFTAERGTDWHVLTTSNNLSCSYTFSSSCDPCSVPPLIIRGELIDPTGWEIGVVNSDDVFCGRVLRYYRNQERYIEPGTTEYFKGTLRIEV
jgi:hypothetical protein